MCQNHKSNAMLPVGYVAGILATRALIAHRRNKRQKREAARSNEIQRYIADNIRPMLTPSELEYLDH